MTRRDSIADKIKNVFETVWKFSSQTGKRGLIFAYDERKTSPTTRRRNNIRFRSYWMFFNQSREKGIPFMLALTGLPTLFPKLVEARTYAERMFHLLSLSKLDPQSSRKAITEPIAKKQCPINFSPESVETIIKLSDGYPFFIQYICREVYDVWAQNIDTGNPPAGVPSDEILRKLDTDFFAGRSARATNRQRDLLAIIADLPTSDSEFTVQEVVEAR